MPFIQILQLWIFYIICFIIVSVYITIYLLLFFKQVDIKLQMRFTITKKKKKDVLDVSYVYVLRRQENWKVIYSQLKVPIKWPF